MSGNANEVIKAARGGRQYCLGQKRAIAKWRLTGLSITRLHSLQSIPITSSTRNLPEADFTRILHLF